MKVFGRKFLSVQLAVIVSVLCWQTPSGEAQAQGPVALELVGKWRQNLAKSKFNSGPPPTVVTIHTWWWEGDSLKHKSERVNEKGEMVSVTGLWTAKYDGKDRLTGGAEDSKVSMKRIDAHTTEMTESFPGRPASIFRQVVSKDGKTLTITRKTEGRDVVDLLVHERQ